MPRPPRRRITQSDVNAYLRDPAFVTAPREFRRAYVALLRSLADVQPYRGD